MRMEITYTWRQDVVYREQPIWRRSWDGSTTRGRRRCVDTIIWTRCQQLESHLVRILSARPTVHYLFMQYYTVIWYAFVYIASIDWPQRTRGAWWEQKHPSLYVPTKSLLIRDQWELIEYSLLTFPAWEWLGYTSVQSVKSSTHLY